MGLIGQVPDGERPRVEIFKGRVAIWAGKGGQDAIGFVLSAASALDTGLAMVRVASNMIGDPVRLNAAEIELLTPADMSEEIAARLVFTAEGAPLAIDLTATQIVELAAATMAIAREL